MGRGGQNRPTDVRAVQDRLVELRAADAAAVAPERPTGAGLVPEETLAQTIEAIESFQRRMALPVDGIVRPRSSTHGELDSAVPLPTRDELRGRPIETCATRC